MQLMVEDLRKITGVLKKILYRKKEGVVDV